MAGFEWLYGPLGLLVGSGGMVIIRALRDRKKLSIEVDAKAVELYERLALRTDQQIATMQTRIDSLEAQTGTLRAENGILKVENMQYKAENEILKSQVERLQKTVDKIESNMP